jgi:hypothetical protein
VLRAGRGGAAGICVGRGASARCTPAQATSKYMEVTVTRAGEAPYVPGAHALPTFAVGIGLAFGAPGTMHNAQRMPGWDPALIGYHSDDGSLFMGKPTADRALTGAWHVPGSVAGVGVFPPGAVITAGSSSSSVWKLVFTLNGALVMERELGAALDVTSLQVGRGSVVVGRGWWVMGRGLWASHRARVMRLGDACGGASHRVWVMRVVERVIARG